MADDSIPATGEQAVDPAKLVGLADQFASAAFAQFGADWKNEITVSLRVDQLSWVLRLAEAGLEKFREQYQKEGMSPVMQAVNLGSLKTDLKKFVEDSVAALSKSKLSKKPRR